MSDTTFRLGTGDPADPTSAFKNHAFIINGILNQLSTATVVKIVRAPYDASGNAIEPGSAVAVGFVDVLPLVNQVDGYGNATPHGTVHRLSYHRYQSGLGAFIADPQIGDTGKMVAADRDTSTVRATNAQANPGSGRRFDKADGTYFGCTQGNAPGQYFAWTSTGFVILDKNGNQIVGDGDGLLLNGVRITLAGDVVTKSGVDLDTHLHSEVTSGSDNSGPPT